MLPVVRQLGAVREIAHTLFSTAKTRMTKGDHSAEDAQAMLDELSESFSLSLKIGTPDVLR